MYFVISPYVLVASPEIVPSSSRSSSSAASPLPTQFVPLLGEALEQVKNTISQVMPMEKPLSALEEAEFEDVGGEAGALEREMLMQGMYRHQPIKSRLTAFVLAMRTLRVYRPRVVIHGPLGMGQTYIGSAALHHLEGHHIQSLELGTLMSDSTRVSLIRKTEFYHL